MEKKEADRYFSIRTINSLDLFAFESHLCLLNKTSWIRIFRIKACLYLEHLLRLFPLTGIHDFGFPVPLRVPDQRGDLTHFLLLKDVGLRANPRHDDLGEKNTRRDRFDSHVF